MGGGDRAKQRGYRHLWKKVNFPFLLACIAGEGRGRGYAGYVSPETESSHWLKGDKSAITLTRRRCNCDNRLWGKSDILIPCNTLGVYSLRIAKELAHISNNNRKDCLISALSPEPFTPWGEQKLFPNQQIKTLCLCPIFHMIATDQLIWELTWAATKEVHVVILERNCSKMQIEMSDFKNVSTFYYSRYTPKL